MENASARHAESTRAKNAQDPLAMGAGRASGLLHLEGAETFSKVRTLMQQAPCLLHSTSPQTETTHLCARSLSETRHQNGEAFHGSEQPWRFPVYRAMHNLSTNFAWSSVSPDSPNQGAERPHWTEEATETQGSNYGGLITEHQRRDASWCAAGSSYSEPATCAASHDASASVRLLPLYKEREWQETRSNLHVEEPDMALPSCSGGSQTSAEMSAKETSSLEKHKVEDCDCQSKNAEVDSAEMSLLRRRPSKRSRVAESHNLSEKRRRNRINEKLKTLQELIPNSSKTDKASILDEAIEYLKVLQSQLQMMSARHGMKASPMIFPTGMQYMQIGHSMGLGFPLMHAGRGGMVGLMDFFHGMDAGPFCPLSTPSPQLDVPYPATAPLACSQPCPITECPTVEFWPWHQRPAQGHQQMYREPHVQTSHEMHRQEERSLSTPGISMDT